MNSTFRPINKAMLAGDARVTEDITELCGPASVTMLVNYCGFSESFSDIHKLMRKHGAFKPGIGTYLKNVPRINSKFRLKYVSKFPNAIFVYLMRHGYVCVASVKSPNGSHIIFVSNVDQEKQVTFYDSNSTGSIKNTVGWVDWCLMTNRRLVFCKVPKNNIGLN